MKFFKFSPACFCLFGAVNSPVALKLKKQSVPICSMCSLTLCQHGLWGDVLGNLWQAEFPPVAPLQCCSSSFTWMYVKQQNKAAFFLVARCLCLYVLEWHFYFKSLWPCNITVTSFVSIFTCLFAIKPFLNSTFLSSGSSLVQTTKQLNYKDNFFLKQT